MGWLEVKKNLFGKIFLFLLIAIISGHTSNATDYAAGTFSFSGSFDSWAKCSETGCGSNTAGNYMYRSITPASGGGMYDVYVYADMDNNLCTSCDFYVDGVDVWPTVSLYAASSTCEARLLGSIPLSSSAHEFRFDRSTDAGGWVELVHLTVNYASGETCGAGQYAYGGSCTNVGANYYSPASDNDRTACPSNSDTNGATTSDAVDDCLGNAGYYNCQTGTCSAAGDDYWSADNSNSRTQCTANSGTGGATTSSAATDCNCDLDYYDSDGGSQDCTAVGTGYYSATNSDSRTACTNSAANSDYTGSGGGSNNCPWGCIADLDESTNCTVCNNTAAIFTNNILQYSALGINSACTLFLDNSTLDIGTFSISGTGDRVFIGSKSKITIL